MRIKVFVLTSLVALAALAGSAQELRDSARIYFRQGYSNLDLSIPGNREALGHITDRLADRSQDSLLFMQKVLVVGGASPEGSVKLNKGLSERRAGIIFGHLSDHGQLPPEDLTVIEHRGRDWKGLIALVERDPNMPYKAETLRELRRIAVEAANNVNTSNHLAEVRRIHGGVPWRYMYRNFFPELRASRLTVWYGKRPNPDRPAKPEPVVIEREVVVHDTVYLGPDTVYIAEPEKPCKPFYMDIHTNMLADVLAIPNIGVEFYLGRNWSIAGNWWYGWWKTDRRHRYWRTYGGDLTLRRWFGKKAEEKPLTGHHLGVYGQILTYDFEFGGKGYMGGEPGGTLWDRMNWGAGIEYGYSLPVGRRLNIDFTLGLGYIHGRYYEYTPKDNCYVWQATKTRNYFGPSKLEVSLVWLIGCDNFNRKKGGNK